MNSSEAVSQVEGEGSFPLPAPEGILAFFNNAARENFGAGGGGGGEFGGFMEVPLSVGGGTRRKGLGKCCVVSGQ